VVGEEHVQSIVQRDELVPVLHPAPQGRLVTGKRRLAEVVALDRIHDRWEDDPGAIERDADATREDRVHEPCGVSHEHELVSADLLHRVAVVALLLEWAKLLRTAERLVQARTGLQALPEVLESLFSLGRYAALLANHPDACNFVRDRNLPHPRVHLRDEVNVDVVTFLEASGSREAIEVFEPGVD